MDPESQAPQAQNVPVAGDSNVPASPASEPNNPVSPEQQPQTPEQPIAPIQQPEQTPAPDQPAEPQPSEPERPQRPAERKIRKQAEEIRELRAQMEALQVPQLSPQSPNLSEQFKDADSIDPADLDKAARELAEKTAQEAQARNDLNVKLLETKLQVKEAVQEFDRDSKDLESIPELDPANDKHIPGLEEVIVSAWKERAVKPNPYNPQLKVIDPSVRLRDVADEQLKVARAAYEAGLAAGNARVAEQNDNLGVPPNGDAPVERSFADLSLAEMEAQLRAKGHDI